jgi:repressor LexA
MSLGQRLRQFRKEKNMSQDELADFLGYKSFTTIQKWEKD